MLISAELLETRPPRLWSIATTIAALTLVGAVPALLANPAESPEQEQASPGIVATAQDQPAGREKTTRNATVPTKKVAGVVVDEADRPISGADVWLPDYQRDKETTVHVTTDQQGRFTLDAPPNATLLSIVWAFASGYSLSTASAREALSSQGDGPSVRVVLRRRAGTKFLILAPDGKPLPGVLVAPYHFFGAIPQVIPIVPKETRRAVEARTGGDGRASLPGVPSDSLRSVVLVSERYGGWVEYFNGPSPLPPEITIRMRAAGRVEGRVIADDPKIVRGVPVGLITQAGTWSRDMTYPSLGQAEVLSDDQGRFVVPAIAEGRLKLRVPIDAQSPYRAKLPEEELAVGNPNPTRVEIRLVRAVRVQGKVCEKGTGRPLADAAVDITYNGGQAFERLTSDREGRFSVLVAPGIVRIGAVFHRDGWRLPASERGRTYSVSAGVATFELPPLDVVQASGSGGKSSTTPNTRRLR